MKLVSFQTKQALVELINRGYLECNEQYVDLSKMRPTYQWVLDKLVALPNPHKVTYPLWCWVKCNNGICPPKHKAKPVAGFDVKITFNKPTQDVFVTDFRRYSFLLSNTYIPTNRADKEQFDEVLKKSGVTQQELFALVRPDKFPTHRTDEVFNDLCQRIRSSFDRCITTDSNVLQGCIWRIELSEVEKIEFVPQDGYCYGSLNYVHTNGKRFDWIGDYYSKLK